jgi:Tfp pilus assembly protein PilO
MVSLVLCFIAYLILIRPQSNNKRRLENNLAEQKQLYASALKATQEESKIQLNEEIQHLQDQLKRFAIDLEDLTDLTFDISQIANKENLASFNVTPRSQSNSGRRGGAKSKKDETEHIKENFIDIKFVAGFRQFANFVNTLERHHPILFINKFKIKLSTKDGSAYQATLDVAALVKKAQNNETTEKASTSTFSAKL